jgi:hypothetical protein
MYNKGNSHKTDINSECKAWVNFNQTGTIAIRDGHNVSSITDNGIGITTINLSSAMASTDFSVVATASNGNGSYNRSITACPLTTTSFNTTAFADSGPTLIDVTYVQAQVFGD